jgi:MerR family transcriptional regulator, thiopeptide resistance regulator
MARGRTYRVGDVAQLTGVSIRTLHHYHEIGLLVPKGRSQGGYRLYGDADLLRLQQILIGRELGLSLDEIRRSLDDERFDHRQALLAQRAQLVARAEQTSLMIQAVDTALAVLGGNARGGAMNTKELFGGFDPSKFEKEAEERWGQSEAYRESRARTERYTADDWRKQQVEQTAILSDAAALMKSGVSPEAPAATAIAERHRRSIDRWFYPCSPNVHAGLADLYESDARFAETFEKHGAGLTKFLSAAIRANARGA